MNKSSASLVVDASFAVGAVLPNHRQRQAQQHLRQWKRERRQILAPVLWLYEVTSALSKTVRFGDLTLDEGREALQLCLDLEVEWVSPDQAQAYRALEWTVQLGRAAAYDSFYLALAEALGCELWTLDVRLHNAVDQPWVRLPDLNA